VKITPELIIEVVCNYFQLQVSSVLTTDRDKELVRARQISMYFIKKMFIGLSQAKIGSYFPGKTGNENNKDHATVFHAIKTVNNLKDTDKDYKKYINELTLNFMSGSIEYPKPKQVISEFVLNENNRLKNEVMRLKLNIELLEMEINRLKIDKQKTPKKEFINLINPHPDKKESPFSKIPSCTNKEYTGYREHQL